MIRDDTIDRAIGISINKKFDEDRENHIPSGKLSASILGNPLQWQILKVIGIPTEFDEYVKRKLQRGKDVEEWVVKNIPGFVEAQKEINYRNTVGFVDALIDTKDYDFKCGIIPHEIKSVANAKYRRIVGTMTKPGQGADHSHLLQSALYSLALGTEYSTIDYVAADDYRISSYVVKADDFKEEIDNIIDKFYHTIRLGVIPEFVPIEKWQAMPDYNAFPEWSSLTPDQSLEKLKSEFPESYEKLINYGKDKHG